MFRHMEVLAQEDFQTRISHIITPSDVLKSCSAWALQEDGAPAWIQKSCKHTEVPGGPCSCCHTSEAIAFLLLCLSARSTGTRCVTSRDASVPPHSIKFRYFRHQASSSCKDWVCKFLADSFRACPRNICKLKVYSQHISH